MSSGGEPVEDSPQAMRAEIARLRAQLQELDPARDAAAYLSAVLDATPLSVIRFDHALALKHVSRVHPPLTWDDARGRSLFDFVEPAYHGVVRAAVEHTRHTGEVQVYETVGKDEHGQPARYRTHVSAVRDLDGTMGVCLVVLDVTAQHAQERALADSEQKLRLALDATKLGLWAWDVDTNEVTWSPGMYELTGHDLPLAFPRYLEVLVHPDERERVARAGEADMARGVLAPSAHRIVRPDGELRWVVATGRVEVAEDGRPTRMFGGLLDVTEQRRTEEQLRHAQRMEAVGNLTAGVAHNFNNMLMAVLPSLELLRPVVPSTHRELLDDATEAAERAADVVRKLMTYAGQRQSRAQVACDLRMLAHQAVQMCQRTFDRHIEVVCHVDPTTPHVSASAAEMEQVLMNLLVNARDAVLEAKKPHPRIEVEVAPTSDGFVVLRVRDDGVGMDERVQRRAFEPFFTTKPMGQGTGLGLATSYAIARDHGGSIHVESRPGEGTTIELRAPAFVASSTPVAGEAARGGTRRATVLLIDDEQAVRRVTERALTLKEHSVVSVGDGEAAKAALLGSTFDVILLDRSMPGSPGSALLPALRELAPRSRILYFTGQDVTPDEARLVDGVVNKPLRIASLLEAVEAALTERP